MSLGAVIVPMLYLQSFPHPRYPYYIRSRRVGRFVGTYVVVKYCASEFPCEDNKVKAVQAAAPAALRGGAFRSPPHEHETL